MAKDDLTVTEPLDIGYPCLDGLGANRFSQEYVGPDKCPRCGSTHLIKMPPNYWKCTCGLDCTNYDKWLELQSNDEGVA